MKYLFVSLLLVFGITCQSQSGNEKLIPKAFYDKMQSISESVLIDVRSADEFNDGAIANAINMNYNDDQFESNIKKLDANKTYFVYCLSGGRSASAVAYMRDNGFKNVYELKGGIMAWKKNNLQVTDPIHAIASDKISAEQYGAITNSSDLVLIDFYAPWCGPCMKMAPLLDQLSKEYEGKAKIVRINIDENKTLTQQLQIDEIPFFKLYRNGKVVGNYVGQMGRSDFERILK